MASLKCLFVVQGEGRGHMTQALALRAMLGEAGHEVVSVVLGRSAHRPVPAFFTAKIGAPLTTISSPNFARDSRQRGIRLSRTLATTLRAWRSYRDALDILDTEITQHQPDLILNFYEPLAGLYYALRRPRIPMVCLGHQYLIQHPDFPRPKGHYLDHQLFNLFTELTAFGATQRLALSFYPAAPVPTQNLRVVPPLLRPEVFAQPTSKEAPFVLVYILNSGYADDIMRWHEHHPSTKLHGFWDRPEVPDPFQPSPNLTFHQLNDTRFLDKLARCSALVTTAGFESIAEALYLGKPVLTVPVSSHYEQLCNAHDAVHAGAGIRSNHFDLDALMAYLPKHEPPTAAFRMWVAQAKSRYLQAIEAAALQRAAYAPTLIPRGTRKRETRRALS